ncbi:50S ribosomal protein P1 [Candidatus Bathyarchaeota archaeon]|nr:MAG: 50S ribosomal protein P1 [Candidatus Bathyarchaeota archaeon]RLI31694.1 MAG: 50S ribosomal protein P1 [Candidatus Bathyarchaeota archaeon]
MESVYAAMLLYSAGKEITEEKIEGILKAAGINPDPIRIKSLVAALSEIDIGEAIKTPLFTAAPAPAPAPAEEKKEEKKVEKKEEKKEEESLQGLAALFQP